MELNRSCYGFEIKKNFYKEAKEKMLDVDYDFKHEQEIAKSRGQTSIFDFLEG